MPTLTAFNKTDLVDDHVAEDINKLIATSLRAEHVNTETITSTKELTDNDTPFQVITPSGANRDVELAPNAVGNHPTVIYNTGTTNNVVVKDSTGATTFVTLAPDQWAYFIPISGEGWKLAINSSGNDIATLLASPLPENTAIILDTALSADGKYSGIVEQGTAGTALAFGDLVYLAVADSRWELTDADTLSISGPVKIGICVLAAAGDGSTTTILLYGKVRADAAFPALTIGAPVYVGTTAGDIQTTEPSNSRIIGYGNTADELFFCPDHYRSSSTANAGTPVQVVHTQTGAVNTGSTTIPLDDTIPQNTEGNEYMTLAITPTSATNKLLIEAVWIGTNSAVNNITVALFQDSVANALAASHGKNAAAADLMTVFLRHEMTAGTTSLTTFKIRAGGNAAGTTTFNGASGARLLGGVLASSIRITEVKV